MKLGILKPQHLYLLVLVLSTFCSKAQTDNLSISEIDEALLKNANSVVRLDKTVVTIPDRRSVQIEGVRIITVLSKNGDSHVHAYKNYDEVTRIKDLSAVVYDASGNEINAFKKKDFKDVAAVDGISLFTDSRVMYLDYTPVTYPYTLVFKSSTVSKNTAFLPRFYGTSNYLSSTEKVYFEINYQDDLGLRTKVSDPDNIIKEQISPGKISYEAQQIPAMKREAYSPSFDKLVSKVLFSLDYFHLEGVDGEATSWEAFGKWMDTYLLSDTQEIPAETAQQIRDLVAGEEDLSERARLVYEFMQDRTRYISVQVGIGGWKPMLASDVDNLGYGDCKALSNYTKSLLEIANVPSYYTILYGDSDKRDIQKDFPSVHGNHAILAVPTDDDYVWLECTSQNVPYGFIANFTDDRDVLIVTPDGGEIVHTTSYSETDNSQDVEGEVFVQKDGSIEATLKMVSKGTQYNSRYDIERLSLDDQKKHYYSFWKYLDNLSIEEVAFVNDNREASFTEDISLKVDSYATFAGDEMILTLNALNRFKHLPKRMKDRKRDIEIDRGFRDVDVVTIYIPDGYAINVLPEDVTLTTDYGRYEYQVRKINDNELKYTRSFIFSEGVYPKEAYTDFRKFLKNVSKHDNQKIILNKLD